MPEDQQPENRPGSAALTIRAATPEDTGLVLDYIRELAAFERLAHKVTADEKSVRKTLFGSRPAARVLLAEWRGQAAGFALFFEMYSTFIARRGIFLEDLFVRPQFRRLGIGRALLGHLAREAVTNGYCRLDWMVLGWNEPAIGFYQRLGARKIDDWSRYRLEGRALDALARL